MRSSSQRSKIEVAEHRDLSRGEGLIVESWACKVWSPFEDSLRLRSGARAKVWFRNVGTLITAYSSRAPACAWLTRDEIITSSGVFDKFCNIIVNDQASESRLANGAFRHSA